MAQPTAALAAYLNSLAYAARRVVDAADAPADTFAATVTAMTPRGGRVEMTVQVDCTPGDLLHVFAGSTVRVTAFEDNYVAKLADSIRRLGLRLAARPKE